jgi:tetratricopeptide (TPR) repeat protein
MQDYLDMYRTSQGEMLEEYAELLEKADDYELTVYATWSVSYARLKPLAKQLYDLLAFMHHDQISEDIFRFAILGLERYSWSLPPTNEELAIEQMTSAVLKGLTGAVNGTWDKAVFMRAVNDLQSYSLLSYDCVNQTYSIHPLVHQWSRTMVDVPHTTCSCTALVLASSVIWKYETKDLAFRRTLQSHIDSLPKHERLRPRLTERFELAYREAGRERDAEMLAKLFLEVSTQLLGREHRSTLVSMLNLARTYSRQGRWGEAEVLEQEALEVTKRVFGNEHVDTMTCMSRLAGTYNKQGRWEEAQVLHREVLEVRKRVLGSDHPDTLTSMTNLAATYMKQGRWGKAEGIQREALEVRKRVSGSEHDHTLTSMTNLAATYMKQGRWKEAEALEREVLEVRKRVLGSEHPKTLTSMTGLAATYWSQGKWGDAEVLQRQALGVQTRVLGREHPNTLESMGWLAVTCQTLGQLREAEMLMAAATEASKRVIGDSHPQTLDRVAWLAKIRRILDAEGINVG